MSEPSPNMLYKQYVAKVDSDDEEGTITAIISTDAVDRDNEVLLPKGVNLEHFVKNPVVMWAHDYHEPPIGKAIWIARTAHGLKTKFKIAATQMAKDVYALCKGGFLKAISVGFQRKHDYEPSQEDLKKNPSWEGARRIIDKWELLEFSVVPIPANPEALITAVKSKAITIGPEVQLALGMDIEEECLCEDTDKEPAEDIGEPFENAGEKPYPNEHACRLHSPDGYDRMRRVNCEQKHDGKCIDVIYGVKDNKSEIQALRYPKKIWTAAAARSHCAGRDGSFEAAETAMIRHIECVRVTRVPICLTIDTGKVAANVRRILKGKVIGT
jgi:HK97 family phage prohead protease